MTARTPNVFIIGAGPVAAALGGALRHAGVPVLGLFGRRPDAVRSAAGIAGVAGYSAAPPDLLLEADAVIFAVRDDAVPQVAGTIVTSGLVTKRHVLLHCSGAMSAAEAFGPLAAQVGGVGTLHPLRAIADPRQAALTMKGTVFAVEGDEVGRLTARELVRWMGGTPLDVEGEGMALYHAAASIASNFLVALVDGATEALAAAGVDKAAGLRALLPLIAGTVDNLGHLGVEAALTGPIVRGDSGTVGRHLRALGERTPELVGLYQVMARRTLAIARTRAAVSPESLDEVERVLAQFPRPS